MSKSFIQSASVRSPASSAQHSSASAPAADKQQRTAGARKATLPHVQARLRSIGQLFATLKRSQQSLSQRSVSQSQRSGDNLDRKTTPAARRTIQRFLHDTKDGLFPKDRVNKLAQGIAHKGLCSPRVRAEIDTIAQKNMRGLDERRNMLKDKIDTAGSLVDRSQMQHMERSTGAEINTEKRAWQTLGQSFDYMNDATTELHQMVELSNKLQRGETLTKKESDLFATTLWQHKENIPILLAHLAKLEEQLPAGSGASALVLAAQSNLADIHLALADMMTFHSDHLPPQPPLSRAQKMNHHLIEAKAARLAVAQLKENAAGNTDLAAALKRIDSKLAQHETNLTLLNEKKLPENSNDLRALLDMPVNKNKKLTKQRTQELKQELLQGSKLPVSVRSMPQKQMLTLYLEAALESLPAFKGKTPDVKFLLERGRTEALNQQGWQPFSREIKFQAQNAEYKVRSSIRPAGEHSAQLAQPYQSKGIGSSDRLQFRHTINLAATELTSSQGEKLFSAHRSGVIDPYDMTPKKLSKLADGELTVMFDQLLVGRSGSGATRSSRATRSSAELLQAFRSDPKETKAIARLLRQQASRVMAEDLASTMILNDPALLAKAEAGEVVALPITSISLMTPDHLRGLSGKIEEKAMAANHKQALDHLANGGEPIALTLRKPNGSAFVVRAHVTPQVLSFGVNAGAVRGLGMLSGNRLPLWRRMMGWEMVAPANNAALTALVGDAARPLASGGSAAIVARSGRAGVKVNELQQQQSALLERLQTRNLPLTERSQMEKDLAACEKQIDKITQLTNQIKTIWRAKSFLREARDPYKMPTRIGLLVDALGEKALFHCKSGKDRTGQMDVEAKYLAAQFYATGQIPSPSTAPDDHTKVVRTKFALQTGNHEMQSYNTGLPGYKLRGVPALDKQFQDAALAVYRGGSAFIGS